MGPKNSKAQDEQVYKIKQTKKYLLGEGPYAKVYKIKRKEDK